VRQGTWDLTPVRRIWGHATAVLHGVRGWGWIDLTILAALGGSVYALSLLFSDWRAAPSAAVEIDLDDYAALFRYTLMSLARGALAYAISLLFTLGYGYWAAKDDAAERILVPLLDILQSIPVLSFLPGVVLALVAAWPTSNAGLELACVLMIFTGQVWNMTFSYYHALRSVPNDLREAAQAFRFTAWQQWKWLELPYATPGLIWNSMMSVAGGWFFLMVTESFQLGDRDFRLPGLGAYMSVAVEAGRLDAMALAVGAMVLMIVLLDQLLWRPLVVWSQKFRVESQPEAYVPGSWFLDYWRRSRIVRGLRPWLRRLPSWHQRRTGTAIRLSAPTRWSRLASRLGLTSLGLVLVWLASGLVVLLLRVPLLVWGQTLIAAILTLVRVLVATLASTLWTLPLGLAIGRSPRLAGVLQPAVQILASFPAPMLFPLVIAVLRSTGVPLGWGSIALMMLGAQWYILFNVIAGAASVPGDLVEAADSYRIWGWQRFRVLYFPALFPYLVTGWVTAAGGAWNASIVSEYVTFRGEIWQTAGLGAQISEATYRADYPCLAASTLVMASMVVVFNRMVWRRLYRWAETRFASTR